IAERQHRAGDAAGELLGLLRVGERDVAGTKQGLDGSQVQPGVAGYHSQHITGLLLADLDQQDEALGGAGESVTAQRADQFGASFGRMLDKPVAGSGYVKLRDQAGISIPAPERRGSIEITSHCSATPLPRRSCPRRAYRKPTA